METLEESLYVAAYHGDDRTIRDLIEQHGIHVNCQIPFSLSNRLCCQETPLFAACKTNHASTVRLLCAFGADPNIENAYQETPLFQCPNTTIAAILLEYGADLHRRNSVGKTCLHCFVIAHHLELVAYFVWYGADINTRSFNGIGLLTTSVQYGSVETTEYLIQKGCDENKISILFFACHLIRVQVVRSILPYVTKEDIYESGALCRVCSSSKIGSRHLREEILEIVQLLLDHGVNPNQTIYDVSSPFLECVQYGNFQAAKLLCTYGACIHVTTQPQQLNALHLVLLRVPSSEIVQMVEWLIEKGMDVESKDIDGWTPLVYAYSRNDFPMVNMLLQHGARMDAILSITSERKSSAPLSRMRNEWHEKNNCHVI
jgi:ankyrin repeat protein